MRFIYLITNTVNRKVYVGQTKDPKERQKVHWYLGRKRADHHLYRSMNHHGIENFSFNIIEECDDELADDRERFWIMHYSSLDPDKGYNMETGGQGGKNLSEETKMKISEALKGRQYDSERRKNISESLKGKSRPNLRKENNPQRADNIRKSLLGRQLSEEHRSAVSEGLKHYFETHEVRHTEESRRNMSEAQKIVGARRSAAAVVDPSDPDAQPKVCPHCGESFSPKKMSPWGVRRHVGQKFCSKKCIMNHNNSNVSAETRSKIAAAKRGTHLSEEQRKKISEGMKKYRRRK